MHSRQHYKIFICSVILGDLESFRNYKGFSTIFPKILGEFNAYEKENFCYSSLHHILESENFRFSFLQRIV